MEALTVPAPQLVLDPPGGPPELEKPVKVQLAAMRFPDAQALTQAEVQKAGAFVYRGAIGAEEVWDESAQEWKPAPADPDVLRAMSPLPFAFTPGDPAPWQSILVAAGQKDKAGGARFAKAQAGSPQYRVRAYAHAKRDGVEHQGLSAPSSDLLFVSAADTQRFAVSLDTGDARTCQRARLLLKNGALAEAGFVEIRATGGQEVEIANCDAGGSVRARVVLAANGDIRLEPVAGGGRIVLTGLLEAEQIRYQPGNGDPRKTL